MADETTPKTEAQHIDGKSLVDAMLENLRAAKEDPETSDQREIERNQHCRPYPMNSPIPKAPPLNEDGSEKEEGAEDQPKTSETPESREGWTELPDDVADLVERELPRSEE